MREIFLGTGSWATSGQQTAKVCAIHAAVADDYSEARTPSDQLPVSVDNESPRLSRVGAHRATAPDALATKSFTGDQYVAEAARILMVSRTRVSGIVNRKQAKFTIVALVEMLSRAGKPVRLEIRR